MAKTKEIEIYNQKGESVGKTQSPFVSEENSLLLAQAVRRQMANNRRPYASTKTRGEVSGGGRKPYKQKGTGNARAGSTRSPLWVGGGITFGPRSNRNYHERMPKKMLSESIRMVLTQKIEKERVIIVDSLVLPKISTKQIQSVFEKLPIEEGKILVITPIIDVNLELSLANIPYAKVVKPENLNVLDLLKFDYIVATSEAFEKITNLFAKEKAAK